MTSPNDQPPNEKRLRIGSFSLQAARGLVRDRQTRRMTMFIIVIIALVMLFLGSTFLRPLLDPHERPGWFIFYWAICAWVTMTALLLAIFDLLLVRAEGRAARQELGEELADPGESDNEDA